MCANEFKGNNCRPADEIVEYWIMLMTLLCARMKVEFSEKYQITKPHFKKKLPRVHMIKTRILM